MTIEQRLAKALAKKLLSADEVALLKAARVSRDAARALESALTRATNDVFEEVPAELYDDDDAACTELLKARDKLSDEV